MASSPPLGGTPLVSSPGSFREARLSPAAHAVAAGGLTPFPSPVVPHANRLSPVASAHGAGVAGEAPISLMPSATCDNRLSPVASAHGAGVAGRSAPGSPSPLSPLLSPFPPPLSLSERPLPSAPLPGHSDHPSSQESFCAASSSLPLPSLDPDPLFDFGYARLEPLPTLGDVTREMVDRALSENVRLTSRLFVVGAELSFVIDDTEIKRLPAPQLYMVKNNEAVSLDAMAVIDRWLDCDYIEKMPPHTRVYLRLTFVETRDDAGNLIKIRPCLDTRPINPATRSTSYPLANPFGLCRRLAASGSFFSTLDAKDAFLQLLLRRDLRKYTAFQVGGQTYRFVSSPFGMKTISQAFSEFMARALISAPAEHYIDDVAVAGHTREDCLRRTFLTILALTRAGLTLNPSKCVVAAKEVVWLGYCISESCVKANPAYVAPILATERPSTVRALRSFLGKINWVLPFSASIASLAEPLYRLQASISRGALHWSLEDTVSFYKVRAELARLISFRPYDPLKTTKLFTDASTVGYGAVVCQVVPAFEVPFSHVPFGLDFDVVEGEVVYSGAFLFPIAAFSCPISRIPKFFAHRDSYSHVLELRALAWALQSAAPFLANGALVYVDNESVAKKLRPSSSDDFLPEIAEILHHNVEVVAIPSRLNAFADALSRVREFPHRPAHLSFYYETVEAIFPPASLPDPPHSLYSFMAPSPGTSPTPRLSLPACFYSTRSSTGSSRPKPIPSDMEPSDMESAFVSPSAVVGPDSPSPFSYLTSLSFSSYLTSVGVTHSRVELDAVVSYRMSSRSRYLPLRSWVHADIDWKASGIRAPTAEQAQLLWSAHVASSHAGMDATLAELRARSPASWPQQRAQVGLMLSCCVRCQLSKSQPHRYPHPTPVPSPVLSPGLSWQADLLYIPGFPLPVLVLVDVLTSYVVLRLLPSKSSPDICAAFTDFFAGNGVPAVISFDSGSEFISTALKDLLDDRGVNFIVLAPRSHHGNAVVERKNRTINQVLRLVLVYCTAMSQSLLSDVQLILNSRPISTRPASFPPSLPSAISPSSFPPSPFELQHCRPSVPSRPAFISAASLPAVDDPDSVSSAFHVLDWLSYVQSRIRRTANIADGIASRRSIHRDRMRDDSALPLAPNSLCFILRQNRLHKLYPLSEGPFLVSLQEGSLVTVYNPWVPSDTRQVMREWVRPAALGFSLDGLFYASAVLRSFFASDPPRLFLDILMPNNRVARGVDSDLVVNLFDVMSPSPAL